jgi:hypothetical protein
VYGLQSTVYSVRFTVYSLQFTVNSFCFLFLVSGFLFLVSSNGLRSTGKVGELDTRRLQLKAFSSRFLTRLAAPL